jgi:uncharacterized protein
MNGTGYGEERRRRGRPRLRRSFEAQSRFRCYAPQCDPGEDGETVVLLPEELEVLRLVDLQGLEQEEAAAVLGISRRTLWRDLHEARRKVADALVHGKGIEMAGCSMRNEGCCPKLNMDLCPKPEGGPCPRRDRSVS